MPQRMFDPNVLASDNRDVPARMRTGTCSKTGSGKKFQIAIRHEATAIDRDPVVATEIVVGAADVAGIAVGVVEIVADVAGIAVGVVEIVADVAGIAVDGKNDLAQRSSHVRKNVRAVTNLILLRHPPQLLEANQVIRPLGRDVAIVPATIAAHELSADPNVRNVVTNHDKPLRVSRRRHPKFPRISDSESLKNNRRPLQNHPLRSRSLPPRVLHAMKRSHKVRKPLIKFCETRSWRPGDL
ncbi:MAG: hypothetical protein IAG10_19345, partial [Planctomycetaceae bacterium]|nr:hypothetical protein [Planctomycetaceae bacterium]